MYGMVRTTTMSRAWKIAVRGGIKTLYGQRDFEGHVPKSLLYLDIALTNLGGKHTRRPRYDDVILAYRWLTAEPEREAAFLSVAAFDKPHGQATRQVAKAARREGRRAAKREAATRSTN